MKNTNSFTTLEGLTAKADYFDRNTKQHWKWLSKPRWDFDPEHCPERRIHIDFEKEWADEERDHTSLFNQMIMINNMKFGDYAQEDVIFAKEHLESLCMGKELQLSANQLRTIIAVGDELHLIFIGEILKDIYDREFADEYNEASEKTAEDKIDDLFNQFSAGDLSLNQLKAMCKELVK